VFHVVWHGNLWRTLMERGFKFHSCSSPFTDDAIRSASDDSSGGWSPAQNSRLDAPQASKTRSSAIAEGPREALVKSCNYKTSHLKTRVPDLSLSIKCVILRLSVLIQYRNVIDTHRQTDRHTTTAFTALSIASRGKNRPYCTAHQLGL